MNKKRIGLSLMVVFLVLVGDWELENMICTSEEASGCRNGLEFVWKQQRIIKNP